MIDGRLIAIDARMIENTGIGTYIQHLMGRGIYDVAVGNESKIRKYDTDVKIIPFDAPLYRAQEQMNFPAKALKQAGVSLTHFPHYNVPLFFRGKYIVTVHDLIHILFPEKPCEGLKSFYSNTLMSHAVKRAEHVLTVSEYTKSDIIDHFALKSSDITVTYNAVDQSYKKEDRKQYLYLYQKYSIPDDRPVILYVGNLKPHKNLRLVFKALERMVQEDLTDNIDRTLPQLILAGRAFSSDETFKLAAEYHIEDFVTAAGEVSKDELIHLYNLADFFIFPSLYEGFGIPPLEAMACGTPVICSDAASLPEVTGKAAIRFDPESVDSCTDAIRRALKMSQAEKDQLIEKGYDRVNMFSWDASADITEHVIRESIAR